MINASTNGLLNTGIVPSKQFNPPTPPQTPEAIAREVRRLEYDLAEERVKPYVVDMTTELPEPKPLISINGSCVCSRGNISAICGEAKSRKTFLTSALVASAMAVGAKIIDNFRTVDKNPDINTLWVDTEQGEQHVRRVIERSTLVTKLMERLKFSKSAAHMRIKRLIDRGLLYLDGDRVASATINTINALTH